MDITLDWDLRFEDIRDSVSWGVLRRFVKANKSKITAVYIRRSSNGNSHVKIELHPSLILTLDQRLRIRAFLRDDVYRVKLDLVRDLVENPGIWDLSQWKPGGAGGTDRQWDWKVKGGVAHEAGEWVRVEVW